jgi:NADH-quinone oxidoreductase subunit L
MAIIGGSRSFTRSRARENDIKRVLAYSTVSQLGYMVMALGVGAWSAGVFHIFTHAFFKALLFLGAGSVSHSGSHHSFDMKKDMGGLRKYMPITFWTFIVGTLALVGFFPFAGFWSRRDPRQRRRERLHLVRRHRLHRCLPDGAHMTCCVYLTFFGEYRGGHASSDEADREHETHVTVNEVEVERP